MTKKINPNLTAEQKLILFEEGTERAGSSELNNEKREGSFHCANCDEYIPSHLGERWDGITYKEAKKEWLLKYKKFHYNY